MEGNREPLLSLPAPMVCRMLFDEICVLANGEIVCSCGDPAALRVFGNVHEDRLADVYNGAAYRAARRWQLEASPGSFCPVLGTECGGRVSRAARSDREAGRAVRTLQLEPVSRCNLRCPGCPVQQFHREPAYRQGREALLPLGTMLDVLGQLPDLEKLLFYNFGEPFLHPDAIPFLRAIRSLRPDVAIHTSTNGLALDAAMIPAIAREGLVDRIVFSIDGASEESYSRYRVGGSFGKALAALRSLVEARAAAGTADRLEIHWQYILFDWNDSDSEIAAARRHARDAGVPLKLVLTHTPGASRRFVDGSPETDTLFRGADAYEALTCDARMRHLWRNGGASSGFRRARIEPFRKELTGTAGHRVLLPVSVGNATSRPWGGSPTSRFRLGVRLRTAAGKTVEELPGPALRGGCLEPEGETVVHLDVVLPLLEGEYELFLDVVEEGTCWFSDRSSRPATIPVRVRHGTSNPWDHRAIVSAAYEHVLGKRSDPDGVAYWAARLAEPVPVEALLDALVEGCDGSVPGDVPARRRRFLGEILPSLVAPVPESGRTARPTPGCASG